jgi:hypothetical protein
MLPLDSVEPKAWSAFYISAHDSALLPTSLLGVRMPLMLNC